MEDNRKQIKVEDAAQPDLPPEVPVEQADETTPTESIPEPETTETADVAEATEAAPDEASPVLAEVEEPTSPPVEAVVVPIAPSVSSAKPRSKKRLLIVLAAIVAVVGVVLAVLFIQNKLAPVVDTSKTPNANPAQGAKLGLAVTLVDGSANYVAPGGESQKLQTGTQLKEGGTVSTEAKSRAVLTLDDGSALRLDEQTTVTLVSLDADNIRVTQGAGTVYSRLVKSDRSYTITADNTAYTALGTAFTTTSGATDKGVQVYESSVKVDGVADAVAEGKQYYKQHHDSKIAGKVTTIDLDALGKSEFATWNLSEDEKSALFKDKLGVLAQLKAKQAKDTAKTGAKKKKTDNSNGARLGLSLSAKAVTGGAELSWRVTAVEAPYGFKLVRSSSSATPTFGKDEALYIDDAAARQATWKSSKDGTYWYRVCIYQKEAGCSNYSNAVQVKVTGSKPKTDKTPKPTAKVTRGTLTLHSVNSSGKAHWSFSGKAPYGYKLVVSKNPGPSYPGSDAAYISDGNATYGYIPSPKKSGTYYVRICAYTNGSESEQCVNYSNEVTYIKL